MKPDYMQPGFVFCQPCRWCWKNIEFTRESGPPADFYCSDKCRRRAYVPKPTPESENYHPDLHKCSLCEYGHMLPHGKNLACTKLGIEVEPEGGCDLFEARKRTTLRRMAEKA